MKKIRFLCSVAGDKYAFGRGWTGEVEDWIADSEMRAGNAEFIDENVPKGLQKPKRVPIVEYPEVHTTIIGKVTKPVEKVISIKKKPVKKRR